MRGHAQIWLNAFQQADHRLGVQPVERQPPPRMMPRLIRAVVEYAHQLRRTLNH
jgi:hypothetical protein